MALRSFEQFAISRREHLRAAQGTRRQRNTDVRYAYEQIRSLIREGAVKSGDLLESRLIEELGAGRNAVRGALQRLTAEGLLARSPKRGTEQTGYILRIPIDDLLPCITRSTATVDTAVLHHLAHEVVTPSAALRTRYGVKAEFALLAEQLVVLAEEPVYRRTTCIPLHVPAQECLERIARVSAGPMSNDEAFTVLFGDGVGYVESNLEATHADAEMASELCVEHGQPLILREMLCTDRAGLVRELSYTHFRGDRVAIVEGRYFQ